MATQTFFIMKSSGETIFFDNYEREFNIDLISGLVSAMFAFIQHSLNTSDLDSVDVDTFRFLFEMQTISNQTYIFILLIERKDNIAEYQPRLVKAKEKFLTMHKETLENWSGGDISIFNNFTLIEREIFNQKTIYLNEEMETELLATIQNLYELTEFTLGAAILTQTGTVVLSFLENSLLIKIIKLLEGRFHSGGSKLSKIVSVENEGILVLFGIENIITAIVFQKDCPMGTALMYGERVSERINKIIKKSH